MGWKHFLYIFSFSYLNTYVIFYDIMEGNLKKYFTKLQANKNWNRNPPSRKYFNPLYIMNMYIRGFTKFGIKVFWRLQFLEYLRTLTETANRADSGQLQFWSEPSEILHGRSSSTPEPVAFTIPWYQTWWNP